MLNNDISTVETGGIILFGQYPQTQEGAYRPIEWVVMQRDPEMHTLMLLSKRILDFRQFNERNKGTNWEKCTLRTWLNEEFFSAAFNEEEKNVILEHEREYGGVYNSCYQRVRNCCDRVSLIGVNEIDEFWLPDGMSDHRINYLFLIYEDTYVKNKVEALPTAYAKTKVDDKLWYSTYWTRDSVWPGPVRYLNSYNQNKAYQYLFKGLAVH